jgi:hypothetical protein
MKAYFKTKRFRWLCRRDYKASDRLVGSFLLFEKDDMFFEVVRIDLYKGLGYNPYACHVKIQGGDIEKIDLEGKARGMTLTQAIIKAFAINVMFDPRLPVPDSYDGLDLSKYDNIKVFIEAIGLAVGVKNNILIQHN